jgi:hypothetical protein
MLATGLKASSKVLVIVLLDLEEKYVMTGPEAKAIADPAARMLMRVKALRRPIKWLTSNSDELALLTALGAYGMRLVDPVSLKVDAWRTLNSQRAQLRESSTRGNHGTVNPPVTPTAAGSNGKARQRPAGPNEPNEPAYPGFTGLSEPIEAGAFIIPGVGIGFNP